MNKLTKEILQERSNKIHNNEYLILGDYVNNHTKILIKHLICGTQYQQQPNNHLQGKGCSKCAGKEKLTTKIFQERSNLKHNSTYQVIGDYINNNTKILMKHLTCGTTFSTLPTFHLKGLGCCTKCFSNTKKTTEQFIKESNLKHNGEYQILSEYINCETKIEIKHTKCGNVFKQTPDKHLHSNKCPFCYGKHKLTKEIIQERSNNKYNNEYEILGEYVNRTTKLLIRHKICGNEYMQEPANHLNNRTCYFCRGTQSNGEKLIDNYLRSKNIEFIYDRAIDGCKNQKSLRFDFFLPKYNICIEYDGEQHFKSISKFGGEDNLKITQQRDKIKNDFCKENNILLIRIPYNEKNVLKILDAIFKDRDD